MGAEKNSVSPFYFFFCNRNDSACCVEDFGIPFFADKQFFLKFSKICKKINFEAFFMHISIYEGTMRDRAKTPLKGIYMVQSMPSKCPQNP